MTLRILVSLLFVSIFGIGGVGLSYAQDDVDREYDLQTQEDMLGTTDNDEFMQIEKTVEKPLFDKKIVKGAHLYASDYLLKMSSYDSDWIGKNPKLLGKAIPYYTDDIFEPLGYEWKVQCLNNKDCGSIIIYTVDNEYALLQASTNGKSNYERILSNKKSNKNKLYYYSPVDQYIESSSGKEITLDTINPDQKGMIAKDIFESMKKEKQQERSEMRKQKLSKKELQNSFFSITDAGTVPGGILPCGSKLPCYSQYSYVAVNPQCSTGCVPTAMSIIFGYYDRNNLKPNLLSGVASDSLMDPTMSNTIRTYMKTRCNSGEISGRPGSTGLVTMADGIQYAKDRGYINSTATLQAGSNLGFYIRSEIKAGRPVMVNIQSSMQNGHTMAGYAYTQSGLTVDTVKVNVGWGAGQPDFYMPIIGTLTGQSGDLGLLNNMQVTSILQVNVQ